MITQLIAYAGAIGVLLAAGAWLMDWLAGATGRPRRWVWLAALAAALAIGIGVPLTRRAAPAAPEGNVASRFTVIDVGPAAASVASGFSRTNLASGSVVSSGLIVASGFSRTFSAGLLWLFTSAGVLLIYVAGHVALTRRRRTWREEAVAGTSVLVSEDIGPALVGVLRPRIVLPAWALAGDRRALDLMLRHEREHQRARDPLLIQAARVALFVMPWNPAAWWMVSRLKLAIELDCDARVLAGAADATATDYGQVLLAVGEQRSRRLASLGPAMLERSSHLARRILAMQRNGFRFLVTRAITAGAATAGLIAVMCITPAPALRASAVLPAAPTVHSGADISLPVLLRSVAPPQQPARPPAGEAVEPGNGVSWPTVVKQVHPKYTKEAMDAKVEGTVVVSAVVETDGSIGRVEVKKSLDAAYGLDQAAVDAALQWSFSPCTKDRKPVACRIELELSFRLVNKDAEPAPAAAIATPRPTLDELVQATNAEPAQPGNGVTWPTLIRQVAPQYTNEALVQKIEGTVYLTGIVDTDGLMSRIQVKKSLDAGLDQSAIDAAKKWVFSPCKRAGAPVACSIQLELDFRLKADSRQLPVRGDFGQDLRDDFDRAAASAYRPIDLDQPAARPLRTWEPKYTSDAMRQKIQGDVYVEILVNPDGSVDQARVIKSLAPDLDQNALDAAKQWVFPPGTVGGRPVKVTTMLIMSFRLH